MVQVRAGLMAQQSRTLAPLLEDPSLICSTHMNTHIHLQLHFALQDDSHGRRTELASVGCPLTSTHVQWHVNPFTSINFKTHRIFYYVFFYFCKYVNKLYTSVRNKAPGTPYQQ